MIKNKYKMVVIFNESAASKLNKGQIATYSSHAAMWLSLNFLIKYINAVNDFENQTSKDTILNYYGYETNINERTAFNFVDWINNDYRKVILSSDALNIDIIHSLFLEHDIPCYVQKTAHDLDITIKSGDIICVAAFGTDEELEEITGKMKLLK